MNNILIPTDFTAHSVKLAAQAICNTESRQVNIILFHAFSMPYYLMDLLSPSEKKPYQNLLTDSFRQACKQLKDEHPKKIGKIIFKCMDGDTSMVFRNFIDANDIDLIICPEDYVYKKIHERSVDPRPLFKKSGIPVVPALKATKKEISYAVKTIATSEVAMQ